MSPSPPHPRRWAPRDEHGFTLVELLVVVLIMGILAAIALLAFTSQTTKARDGTAKHAARGLYGAVEACNTGRDDYTQCSTKVQLTSDQGGLSLGLDFGPGPGQVEVQSAKKDSFDAVAHSPSGGDFTVTRNADGSISRTCSKPRTGGCSAAGTW